MNSQTLSEATLRAESTCNSTRAMPPSLSRAGLPESLLDRHCAGWQTLPLRRIVSGRRVAGVAVARSGAIDRGRGGPARGARSEAFVAGAGSVHITFVVLGRRTGNKGRSPDGVDRRRRRNCFGARCYRRGARRNRRGGLIGSALGVTFAV